MKGILHTVFMFSLAGIAAMAMITAFQTGEAKAQDGKNLYMTKGCMACHGADGKAPIMPIYPKLNGQNSAYLVAQMQAFKTQQRKGGQAALMWGMAAQLSDDDMKKIADYLQGVK